MADAEALLPSASDPEVWRWKLVPRPTGVDDMRALIDETMLSQRSGRREPFKVSRLSDGLIIGSTSLANFDLHHGRVEMGFTWLDRACWGQGYNEDAKCVLLGYCFDVLGLSRVEWQVDSQNARSQRSLERMGFTYEGTLRSRHRRPDGSRRDSMYYGLLVEDWPEARRRLARQIDERHPPQPTR